MVGSSEGQQRPRQTATVKLQRTTNSGMTDETAMYNVKCTINSNDKLLNNRFPTVVVHETLLG